MASLAGGETSRSQSPEAPKSPGQQRRPGKLETCCLCLVEFDTPEGKGETTKCGHMHIRCLDRKLEWGASSRCVECRVQTVILNEDQEFWDSAVTSWIRFRYDECFEPTQAALKNDPESAAKNRLLGDLYFDGQGTARDIQQAKSHYELAIRGQDDDSSVAHSALKLGSIYHSEIRFEDALEHYELAQSKNHPEAAERVAYTKKVLECLEALKTERRALRCFDSRLRSDWPFARRAVEISGFALEFLCEEFQSNEEIVFEAVRENIYALQFASPSLRGSSAFINCLLSDTTRRVSLANGWELEFVSDELRDERELVSSAVAQSGGALEFASARLQEDREVVMQACRQDGLALEFASEALRGDAEVVSVAVVQNASAMKFATDALRGDADFILSLMRHSSFAFRFASRELRENRKFVMQAIKRDGLALRWAADSLHLDPRLMLEAEKRCGWALAQAPKELLDDRDFMLEAIKNSNQALNFAPEEFLNDHASLLEAVKTKGTALQFAPKVCCGDRDLVAQASRQNMNSIYFADGLLRESPAFLNDALAPVITKKRNSGAGSKGVVGSKASVDIEAARKASGSKRRESLGSK